MRLNPLVYAGMLACALTASGLAVAAPHDADAKADAKENASKAHADADMQAVLDAHAGLKPKPIEKLSAAEARKQPTPADAVGVVL